MYALIVFLPLIGFMIAGVIALSQAHKAAPHAPEEHGHHGPGAGDKIAQYVTIAGMLASLGLSVIAFAGVVGGSGPVTVELIPWITSGDFIASWALRFDTLTVVMLIVVTGVSTMVHIYSVGYMSHDPHPAKFMAYLSLFTFAMLMLVTADNLILLFFGWAGVGLASYLLIGFWYKKQSACAAAIKAFVVNRVGDFGFILGIFAVYVMCGTVQFDEIFAQVADMAGASIVFLSMELHALTVICLLLFLGAMGKSAQLGLHTWLPDAMEGPTPVSALIHAATMVTAGVFMVARLSPLFEYSEVALATVTVIGALTAFFAATVGCVQNDIKRVIAYSTCSQLGYMFFACGVSAYSAGVWHLMTHGFFKALLFLGAGSVIHAMSDEQDMRKMGGLRKLIPTTFWLMVIGNLALTGFPFMAGWYSKDLILESALMSDTGVGGFAFTLGILAAGMTSFYSWRLMFMTFFGESRADETTLAHVHESPPVMIGPLIPLAVGAILAGAVSYSWFADHDMANFWNNALLILPGHDGLENAHNAPWWAKGYVGLPALMFWGGLAGAYVMYVRYPSLPGMLAERLQSLYRFVLNKWYFDELYDRLFVKPAFWLGRGMWQDGDGRLIDGVGPNGVAAAVRVCARWFSSLQSGLVYHYAFAMLIGIAALVTYTFILVG